MPGCAPTTITANPCAVPCSQPGPRHPLNATTPGDYEWALVHRTGMEASIGDAAEQLARHDLDQHNPTQATWAARRGLLASPYDQPLYRQLMRAASTAGNPCRRGHHHARAPPRRGRRGPASRRSPPRHHRVVQEAPQHPSAPHLNHPFPAQDALDLCGGARAARRLDRPTSGFDGAVA
jgi:hypothetical protein